MVSRRISTFGLQLCEGDLVYEDSSDSNPEVLDEDVSCDEDAVDEVEPPSEEKTNKGNVFLSSLRQLL